MVGSQQPPPNPVMEWVVEAGLVAANLQIKMQHCPSNKYPCKEPWLSLKHTSHMARVIKRDTWWGMTNGWTLKKVLVASCGKNIYIRGAHIFNHVLKEQTSTIQKGCHGIITSFKCYHNLSCKISCGSQRTLEHSQVTHGSRDWDPQVCPPQKKSFTLWLGSWIICNFALVGGFNFNPSKKQHIQIGSSPIGENKESLKPLPPPSAFDWTLSNLWPCQPRNIGHPMCLSNAKGMRLTNRPHKLGQMQNPLHKTGNSMGWWDYQHFHAFSIFLMHIQNSYEVYRCTSCICFLKFAQEIHIAPGFLHIIPLTTIQLWFRALLPSCLGPIQSSQEANQQKKPIQKVRKECNVPQRECQSDIRKMRETSLKCSDFVALNTFVFTGCIEMSGLWLTHEHLKGCRTCRGM